MIEPTVYISLTTIFQRQRQCAQAIQSLLQQTLPPKKIYLFVSEKPYLLDKGIRQYCLDPSLTEITLKYPQLEVQWVENEGPYRKLLPALKKLWQRENTLLLTCDDDIVYKKTFVETAVKLWKEKQCCIGFEGSRIQSSFQYNSFPSSKGSQHLWNLATGVGGILYDPKWFSNKEIFQWREFPYTDDLWITAWRIAANVECYIHTESSIERSFPFQEKQTLWTAFNKEQNTGALEKIIHSLVYKGHIQNQESFFEPLSQILFQWNSYIQTKLVPVLGTESLEGSLWNKHMTKEPHMGFFEKQKNLALIARDFSGSAVCEIGFNAGFSALLILLANPSTKLQCLDLGEHTYTRPAFEQLKQDFGDRISLLLGDSQQTMKTIQDTFDFVHVDGGHSEVIARSDCQEALRVLKSKGFLLVDDTNLGDVENAVKSVQTQIEKQALPFPTILHSLYRKKI